VPAGFHTPRSAVLGQEICTRSGLGGFSVVVQAATSKLNGSSKRRSPWDGARRSSRLLPDPTMERKWGGSSWVSPGTGIIGWSRSRTEDLTQERFDCALRETHSARAARWQPGQPISRPLSVSRRIWQLFPAIPQEPQGSPVLLVDVLRVRGIVLKRVSRTTLGAIGSGIVLTATLFVGFVPAGAATASVP